MIYALFGISKLAAVFSSVLSTTAARRYLKKPGDTHYFNLIIFAMCTVVFAAASIGTAVSVYTLLLGGVFGVLTAYNNVYALRALALGPLGLTNLITTSSIILSSLSGVVLYGERFSIGRLISTVFLIGFVSLAITKGGKQAKVNTKWLVYCALAFVLQGAVGITQKVQQNSAYATQIMPFLATSFLAATLCSLFSAIPRPREHTPMSKKGYLCAVGCGACTVAMNYINLLLSGKLPSQFFFPFSAGLGIVSVSLVSVLVFKERLSRRQVVGLVGGIVSLIAICIFQ